MQSALAAVYSAGRKINYEWNRVYIFFSIGMSLGTQL